MPPVAEAGPRLVHDLGAGGELSLTLNGGNSYDTNGEALHFSWRQLDGQRLFLDAATEAAQTVVVNYPGRYVFELEVVASDGQYAYDRVTHVVHGAAQRIPTALIEAPSEAFVADEVPMSGASSFAGDDDFGLPMAPNWPGPTLRLLAPVSRKLLSRRRRLVITSSLIGGFRRFLFQSP